MLFLLPLTCTPSVFHLQMESGVIIRATFGSNLSACRFPQFGNCKLCRQGGMTSLTRMRLRNNAILLVYNFTCSGRHFGGQNANIH